MSPMSRTSIQIMNRSNRRQWAAVLTFIYVMILCTPLAPFAMHSKYIAHAVTGECSGDCDIDGCSLESRANHTCCCAQKKVKLSGGALISAGECCAPKVAVPVVAKGDCCATPQPVVAQNDWVVAQGDCCAKPEQPRKTEISPEAQSQDISSKKVPVYKCGTPCGKGKLLAVASAASSELLPYFYSESFAIPHETTQYTSLTHRMTSRHAEPPDQPPKLSEIV